MSFRWALSQFTGGMDEITPVSLQEHFYTLSVFLVSWWMGNSIVSILTSHMTRMYIEQNGPAQRIDVMRRYLRQNGVSRGVSVRVVRNAQHSMSQRDKQLTANDAGLADWVTTPLLIEVHLEIYGPMLSFHPFFQDYLYESPN